MSKDENSIRVKADPTGVELSVGRSLPDLITQLLPSKVRTRRLVNDAIGERIVSKIRADDEFDEAECAFAEAVLSDQALKYIRVKRTQNRAFELREESLASRPDRLIGAGQSNEPGPNKTPDDWLNKFREDASLVDDEMIREIYARVLHEESIRPTAFSLRTLGVLRYLDSEVATAFNLIQKILIAGLGIPADKKLHDFIGLKHITLLRLADAGLINSTASVYQNTSDAVHFELPGHGVILSLRNKNGHALKFDMPLNVLTPAGMQLAKIADSVEKDEPAREQLVQWLASFMKIPDSEAMVATMPVRNWRGNFVDLEWEAVFSR